ncbi:DUF6602 domain-containing protein [Vibrio sp. 1CM8B]|uniref:DUF6602 domain-containing protein n=1 Tax=Vibrio sp. 1CM8B TaxID=2929167 RepID=UPI0020C1067F|nr:DUF6602 domain-containing protein [Vibrio sp. 1CM8B]MCK8087959.1 hypothetical protein [Vibrio sp. 1CM8B]
MDKLLSPYYQAIAQKIDAEVSDINDLFEHQGVKGEGNENVLVELLEKFLPKKYAIGTGVVVDHEGQQSKQCDIIIYDAFNYPEIFAQTDVKFFPVDFVYAVIEVKTTLSKKKMTEAIENIKSVKKLKFIKQSFREMPVDPVYELNADTVMWNTVSTTSPQGYIFGFSSSAKKFTTFQDWFEVGEIYEHTPSHVFCLDHGILLNHVETGVHGFMCPLYDQEMDGYYTNKDGSLSLCKNKPFITVDGKKYPLSEMGKRKIAIDQSKVLLEFLTILNELLSFKKLSPNINIYKEYLPKDYKLKFALDNGELVVIR